MRIDAKGAAAPTYRELGEPYGLTAVAVYYIVSGKHYKEPEAQPDDPC